MSPLVFVLCIAASFAVGYSLGNSKGYWTAFESLRSDKQ